MKFILFLLLVLSALPGWAETVGDEQVAFSRGYLNSQHPPEFELTSDSRLQLEGFRYESKSFSHSDCNCSVGLVVRDTKIYLSGDHDYDGYYHLLKTELDLDLDDTQSDALVFAVISLSYEGGPWNHLFTTESFLVEGITRSDSYIIESHLKSGYPTGFYDVLVEVFDSSSGHHLLSHGPNEDRELRTVPLEGDVRDSFYGSHADYAIYGSGSVGWITLMAMLFAGLCQGRWFLRG